MEIQIHRNETSKPILYNDAINAYTKGQLYCVMLMYKGQLETHKYPLCSIFRIIESYGEAKTEKIVLQE